MDKITFTFSDTEETVEFFVVEETKLAGRSYLLVTEDEDGEEADAYILKDMSAEADEEAVYEIVEDDGELEAVSKIFGEMLDDVEFERE